MAEQLAQLRWRRSQNERSVKSALEATKTLKQKDTILNLTSRQNFDKSYWVNSVLKDELTRPLIISDEEYVNGNNADEAFKHRLLKYSNQQLDNIDRLADSVAGRTNRHEDAVKLKIKQLEDLQVIKDKLKTRISLIENKKPYQSYSGEG